MRHDLLRVVGLVLVALRWGGSASAEQKGELWLHPDCRKLPTDKQGPFVRTGDGGLLAIGSTQAFLSSDDGKTWTERPLFPGRNATVGGERAMVRTRDGIIILGFMNEKEAVWKWNAAKSDSEPGVKLPFCIIRSLDDGKTWTDFQVLHDAWTGDTRDMIQTRSGRVIVSSMNMLHNPGRHSVLTYSSADGGKTWTRSNIIDLGGCGHHGGVTEATIEQLRDGKIWMLMRTNWDRFWEAFSEDEGVSWRVIRPSKIEASCAPGMLKRLKSGRLVLIWNRPYPEGKTSWPRVGGDNQWSEVPALNHREELSIAFSDDDGQTWSKPVVLARQKGAWLSYPHIFEHSPGVLWVTTMQGGLRVSLAEEAFAKVKP